MRGTCLSTRTALKYFRSVLQQKKKLKLQPRAYGAFSYLSWMSSLAEETFALVTQELALPELREEFDEQKAVELLTKAVKQLLDQNLERFLQICYRVDLAENTLKKILAESPPEQLASDLAQALWDRQKQKIVLRRRYSGTEGSE